VLCKKANKIDLSTNKAYNFDDLHALQKSGFGNGLKGVKKLFIKSLLSVLAASLFK